MKRYNLTEASIAPCTLSWTLISFLLVLCFFSCSCRNKTNSVQLTPVDSSMISGNLGDTKSFEFTPKNDLANSYSQVVSAVKSKTGYSMFYEFLERGKYSDIFNRQDKMDFILIAPSDEELNKLDNATISQLIYPEMPDQSNLNFMIRHVGLKLKEGSKSSYQSMTGKKIELETNLLTIDGLQIPVRDEVQVNQNIKILFISNYLN